MGDSQTMRLLVEEVRGGDLKTATSPNPVSKREAMELVEKIKSHLPAAPQWLQAKISNGNKVITFGGTTSCFRLLYLILDKSTSITQADLERAIDLTVGKTPEELSVYPQEELLFAKLGLMLAVAQQYNIQEIDWHWANGSTLGIAIFNDFW
jgi:hypothetical protein